MGEKSMGALWVKKGKVRFLSGIIEHPDGTKMDIVVFKNTYKKEGDNQPDFRIFEARPKAEVPPPEEHTDVEPF